MLLIICWHSAADSKGIQLQKGFWPLQSICRKVNRIGMYEMLMKREKQPARAELEMKQY